MPRHRNRSGMAAEAENRLPGLVARPSLACHQNTVIITGSGVNGCRSRLRRLVFCSEACTETNAVFNTLATAAEPSAVGWMVKSVFPQPNMASLVRNLLSPPHSTDRRVTEELQECYQCYPRTSRMTPETTSMHVIILGNMCSGTRPKIIFPK